MTTLPPPTLQVTSYQWADPVRSTSMVLEVVEDLSRSPGHLAIIKSDLVDEITLKCLDVRLGWVRKNGEIFSLIWPSAPYRLRDAIRGDSGGTPMRTRHSARSPTLARSSSTSSRNTPGFLANRRCHPPPMSCRSLTLNHRRTSWVIKPRISAGRLTGERSMLPIVV